MIRRRLIWQLYPSYLFVTLLALVAVAWYSSRSFRDFYLDQIREELDTIAYVAAEQISGILKSEDTTGIDALCKRLGQAGDGQTRITVMLPSGKVIGDSDEDPAIMEDHSDRPEIINALRQGSGRSLRFSQTLGRNMMYVAIPVGGKDRTLAVVRAAIPATAIDRALHDIYVKIFYSGLAVAAFAAVLSWLISRRISRPIVSMTRVAERFAHGELDRRVPVPASVELAALARALNTMATELQERILTITGQRNELEAVLSSMVEGVLAVDGEGHIVSINKAAAGFLDVESERIRGRSVEEVTRNVDIQQFVRDTLAAKEPTEMTVNLLSEGERLFQLHGTSLRSGGDYRSGAVIVLNDVTKMRRLESLRRDFVANVSHELKTPVTSIQGFVEELLDGAVQDPSKAERYLKIVAKHSDRLNAIIDDLLSLSRLEESSEKRQISFEEMSLRPVLRAAIELSAANAEKKQMEIILDCDESLHGKINSALLEQALANLIDNAIKYSDSGSQIQVTAEKRYLYLGISVQDTGCGIAPEYLARIFERFYVVDRGRSRKLGGTGLGLAIVKHIAQVHGGHVTVDSILGQGSTFTIHLPSD